MPVQGPALLVVPWSLGTVQPRVSQAAACVLLPALRPARCEAGPPALPSAAGFPRRPEQGAVPGG